MARRLPPLNALKAFEATARHLSVKLAAEELCVTPGAVSQMLKILEENLGVKLFDRVTRGIYLTDAGRDYLPAIRNAFRQITEASERIAAQTESGLLTVSVTPFFASAWLVPRLASFREAQPDIDLQVVTSNALVDFSRSDVDVAIRHGMGRYPGLRSDRVVTVEMIAAATPDLVEKLGAPTHPSDLAHWPQVHDAERKGWSLWFDVHNVAERIAVRGPSFDDSGLMLKAVLAGQGAGLLPAALVEDELANGKLIQLLPATNMEEFAYYLVCPDNRQQVRKIAAFRDWILSAQDRSRASLSNHAAPSPQR
ncbi:transcriptional regulator GcvA [Bordetella genomosp. 4]|uniref:transcriptional regulator GcvA n=1 Tax=Bordetella genomosp. 4 TaxID=463044 RepID=UPI000B9E71A8|nr:transcriptional regulator GcvA [Bordetella genomosp. 4]OZI52657.1 LysR family transcriptional regulator [Bordetella genomosp. 4]